MARLVMLGAGLDTRPHRLLLTDQVHWYELDRRDVLEAMASALAGHAPRGVVTSVDADLARDPTGGVPGEGALGGRRASLLPH